ncbi:hypothetical protein TrST_g10737 [Triparma strigata]|uniref:NFACT protein C-terminal domain-containing protein n=1 Tax=Triparma strigata TaxID=1606541 RepID=A0A9W7BVT3_9STRA|nr:hypothetical protein TrST_g10737 [Triparma strigata]
MSKNSKVRYLGYQLLKEILVDFDYDTGDIEEFIMNKVKTFNLKGVTIVKNSNLFQAVFPGKFVTLLRDGVGVYEEDGDYFKVAGEVFNDIEKVKDRERLENSKIQLEKDLEKVRLRESTRLQTLQKTVSTLTTLLKILETQKSKVDGVFHILRGLRSTREDWSNLTKFLQNNKSGDGRIISSVNWDASTVTVDLTIWGYPSSTPLDFSLSCGKNLESLYEKLNYTERKFIKTEENVNKAVEAGERKGRERLKVLEIKVKQRELGKRRNTVQEWYAPYRWSPTSGNRLAVRVGPGEIERVWKRFEGGWVFGCDGGGDILLAQAGIGEREVEELGEYAGTFSGSLWTKKVRSPYWYAPVEACKLKEGRVIVEGDKGRGRPGMCEVGFGVVFYLEEGRETEGEKTVEQPKITTPELPQPEPHPEAEPQPEEEPLPEPPAQTSSPSAEATPAPPEPPKEQKKKGLSAHDRKMIKKYGSLEAAEAARKERELEEANKPKKKKKDVKAEPPKKKEKKLSKKKQRRYEEQDEEDRKLAMEALQGKSTSTTSDDAPVELADFTGLEEYTIFKGHGLNAEVVDKLRSLDSEKLSRVIKRFTELNALGKVEHGNSSLMGIIRTVSKYTVASASSPLPNVPEMFSSPTSLNHWTGSPLPHEKVLFCKTVTSSHKSMKNFKCKVKLSPGGMKRGKLSKQCVNLFMKVQGLSDQEKDSILALDHNMVSMSCIGDAKVDGKDGKLIEKIEKEEKKKKQKEKKKAK